MGGKREAARQTILSLSPDSGLLLSRTQLLKSAGYDVIAAPNRQLAIAPADDAHVLPFESG